MIALCWLLEIIVRTITYPIWRIFFKLNYKDLMEDIRKDIIRQLYDKDI